MHTQPKPMRKNVFVSGEEGYDTYRIPALLCTKDGVLLAFIEGRHANRADYGDIDLLLKRSFDFGATWEPLQIVWDDGENTCGNPAAVQDADTGRIWLFATRNKGTDTEDQIRAGISDEKRTVWNMFSDDNGATWSSPVNISETVQPEGTLWDGTGPGNGIQLKKAPYKGRLVIPANGYTIYSNDHGETWIGGKSSGVASELTVAELPDGTLTRNDRNEPGYRAISLSYNGGESWCKPFYNEQLLESCCEGSQITFYRGAKQFLMFSNPADQNDRVKMTVRLSSKNSCMDYDKSYLINEGPSGYSSLAQLSKDFVGILYEEADPGRYPCDRIVFVAFGIENFLK